MLADLVAAGGTYREVADALFMSPKTVQWNLSKIYRKLGIRSRAQLAASLRSADGDGSNPADRLGPRWRGNETSGLGADFAREARALTSDHSHDATPKEAGHVSERDPVPDPRQSDP